MIFEWLWKDWENQTSEEETRPSKSQCCFDRLEYIEESVRPEENSCHSEFSEESSAETDAKARKE